MEYNSEDYHDPACWDCINVVLAIAHRFRAMNKQNNFSEDYEAWGYLQNALATVTDVAIMQPTLTTVQALLGMVLVVQGTSNSRLFSTLLSSAIHGAHDIGLYRHLIQGQVYKRLLSVPASKQSVVERIAAFSDLEGMLYAWRDSTPIKFEEKYVTPFNVHFSPPLIHEMIVRLTYFKKLDIVCSHSILGMAEEAMKSRARSGEDQGGYILPASPLSKVEARKALQLIHETPMGDYAYIWVVLYIFVSATKTLLSHICSEPSRTLAKFDVELIKPSLNLLEALINGEQRDEVVKMYDTYQEMYEQGV